MITEVLSNQNSIARQGQALLEFLREHQHILSPLLILTHDYPDPDSKKNRCSDLIKTADFCGAIHNKALGPWLNLTTADEVGPINTLETKISEFPADILALLNLIRCHD